MGEGKHCQNQFPVKILRLKKQQQKHVKYQIKSPFKKLNKASPSFRRSIKINQRIIYLSVLKQQEKFLIYVNSISTKLIKRGVFNT